MQAYRHDSTDNRRRSRLVGSVRAAQAMLATLPAEALQSEYQNEEEEEEAIPVRWSAPEVLRDASFSSKSDVWSFGAFFVHSLAHTALTDICAT